MGMRTGKKLGSGVGAKCLWRFSVPHLTTHIPRSLVSILYLKPYLHRQNLPLSGADR
jgi:hypothetical protein